MSKSKNFSERMGLKDPSTLQINSMDDRLKTHLWNTIFEFLFEEEHNTLYGEDYKKTKPKTQKLIRNLWKFQLGNDIDSIPVPISSIVRKIKENFKSREYNSVYDFIEYLIAHVNRKSFNDAINKTLANGGSGYRVIAGQVSPITNEYSQDEITKGITQSKKHGLKGVATHLDTAVRFLRNSGNPDYRNSIKESISAVESISQSISGKNTLGSALIKIQKQKLITIHPALQEGFNKIYGYTSDEGGIRHALLNEDKLEQEDAIFMLVSCSAFVNYLIVKADKAGIPLK